MAVRAAKTVTQHMIDSSIRTVNGYPLATDRFPTLVRERVTQFPDRADGKHYHSTLQDSPGSA
jgi:hypothetical protein